MTGPARGGPARGGVAYAAAMPAPGNAPELTRVVAAVVRRGDRYLVCQRPAHKRHGMLWEFPGGKVHPGESTEQAVRRELAEELDVDVTGIGAALFTSRDPGSPFVVEFIPAEVAGEPRALEHAALAWATLAEMLALALAPTDRAFATVLAAPPV